MGILEKGQGGSDEEGVGDEGFHKGGSFFITQGGRVVLEKKNNRSDGVEGGPIFDPGKETRFLPSVWLGAR